MKAENNYSLKKILQYSYAFLIFLMIIPTVYLVSLILDKTIYNILASMIMALVGVLFISKIKIPKPKGNILYFF